MSGELNLLTLRDAAYWRSRTQYKSTPGPRPTLGDLHRATPWVWGYCEKCQHYAPLGKRPVKLSITHKRLTLLGDQHRKLLNRMNLL
jgi:hypothetical protein